MRWSKTLIEKSNFIVANCVKDIIRIYVQLKDAENNTIFFAIILVTMVSNDKLSITRFFIKNNA